MSLAFYDTGEWRGAQRPAFRDYHGSGARPDRHASGAAS